MSTGSLYIPKLFGRAARGGFEQDLPYFLDDSLGWDIVRATDRFPRYMAFLTGPVGEADVDALHTTYDTCCINEAVLMGQVLGTPGEAHSFPVNLGPGRHFINREIRMAQAPLKGTGGGGRSYGDGKTEIVFMDDADWRSIHGAQNDGIKIGVHGWNYAGEDNADSYPVCLGGPVGEEWAHGMVVEDILFRGTVGDDDFWDRTKREVGIMLYSPGELSMIFRCGFHNFNDFGVMVSHKVAPAVISHCSFFRNKVAMVGIRGGAHGSITLDRFSGDFNPAVIRMFRGSTDIFGTGSPYFEHAVDPNPGGTVEISNAQKIEDSCFRSGYTGHVGGPVSPIGKGTILAVCTGRFHFKASNINHSMYSGQVHSLVEVYDDDDIFPSGSSIPLHNSSVELNNVTTVGLVNPGTESSGARYWLHNWTSGKAYLLEGAAVDLGAVDFRWENLHNGGKGYFHKQKLQGDATEHNAVFQGQYPYINYGTADTWEDGGSPPDNKAVPDFGFDTVTGIDF